jgi:hypothetical protein
MRGTPVVLYICLHCVVLSSAQRGFLLGLRNAEAEYTTTLLNAGKSNRAKIQ